MPQVKISFRTKKEFESEHINENSDEKYHLIDDRLNIIIPEGGITQYKVDQEIEKLKAFFENE